MKTLCCLLFILASFESYAQVKENIKVKHQSQTRGRYVPETFPTEAAPTVQETKTSQKKSSSSNQKKGLRR